MSDDPKFNRMMGRLWAWMGIAWLVMAVTTTAMGGPGTGLLSLVVAAGCWFVGHQHDKLAGD